MNRVMCHGLSPGNNPCTINESFCENVPRVHISWMFPEQWTKKKESIIVLEGTMVQNLEQKFDSFFIKSIDNKKPILNGGCKYETNDYEDCK